MMLRSPILLALAQGMRNAHAHWHEHVSSKRATYHAFCLTKPTLPRPLQIHK